VLLVDGDPASDPLDRETALIAWALQPEDDSLGAAGRYTPFETHTVTADELAGVDWKEHAVVILANVRELPADKADELKRYVRGGGALLVFLGANVRPDFYQQAFGGEGDKLLPGTLGEVQDHRRAPVHLEIGDDRHPLAVYFDERKEMTHLLRPVVSFSQYYQVNDVDEKAARVAFRFTDDRKSPAVLDNGYGNGRVIWIPTTADDDWNDLAKWPDYVVFLYEAISYVVQFGMESSNLVAGEPFRKLYPAAQYASEVMLLVPESDAGALDGVRNLRKAMKSLGGGTEFELTHDATTAPGLYRLDLLRPANPAGNTVEHFAVNIDTAESDLQAMSDDDFTAFPGLNYAVFDATERLRAAKGDERLITGREFWRWFLAGVLGLLILETLLAWAFGRRGAA
jgi:hypothetical protein